MTQIQTAIKEAEKTLEQERKEKLQREVYEYLKQELEAIDAIDQKVRKLETEKRAHEENIKNIKQGNLEAIEKRRQAMGWPVTWAISTSAIGNYAFYSANVAGTTVTTSSGKTYIF